MIHYEVVVEGVDEQIERLNAHDQIAQKHLRRAMSDSVKAAARVTRSLAPVGQSGRARAGVDHEVAGGRIVGDLVGRVVDRAFTGLWLEFGTRAHTPPTERIADNLGVSRDQGFLIARSIGRKGTRGRHFMYRAYVASKRLILTYFGDALERIATELGGRRAP
jgi:hypothetical protein